MDKGYCRFYQVVYNKYMNNEQALNILIQACRVAQQKGAFTLEDAVAVKSAIDVFVKPIEEVKEEPIKSVEEKENKK